jgi:glycosyltransferase involved in cell wall biosynthesis
LTRTRVLHLIASSRGGGATHVRDLALALDQTRYQVAVAMPEDGGNVGREDLEPAGVPLHRVDIASGFSVGALRRIRQLAGEADILHVHGARAALFGRLAALSLGSRRPGVVFIIQGFSLPFYSGPRRWLLLEIERSLARVTDAVIAVSEEERRAFLIQGTAPAERVSVVLNSVHTDPFRQAEVSRVPTRAALNLPAETTVITTICRLYKPRDFETLLGAFSRLAHVHPNIHLLIVGDGPDRPQIETLRAQLGLGGRVTLTGQRRDVPALLAASDIYTLTTWGWEGLPFTILEAMAAARPVVATRAGGIPEALEEGKTGLLVPRRDPIALAEALRQLVNDPARRVRMGIAGRRRAETLFTQERMVESTMRVYTQVLQDRTPKRQMPQAERTYQ